MPNTRIGEHKSVPMWEFFVLDLRGKNVLVFHHLMKSPAVITVILLEVYLSVISIVYAGHIGQLVSQMFNSSMLVFQGSVSKSVYLHITSYV